MARRRKEWELRRRVRKWLEVLIVLFTRVFLFLFLFLFFFPFVYSDLISMLHGQISDGFGWTVDRWMGGWADVWVRAIVGYNTECVYICLFTCYRSSLSSHTEQMIIEAIQPLPLLLPSTATDTKPFFSPPLLHLHLPSTFPFKNPPFTNLSI